MFALNNVVSVTQWVVKDRLGGSDVTIWSFGFMPLTWNTNKKLNVARCARHYITAYENYIVFWEFEIIQILILSLLGGWKFTTMHLYP